MFIKSTISSNNNGIINKLFTVSTNLLIKVMINYYNKKQSIICSKNYKTEDSQKTKENKIDFGKISEDTIDEITEVTVTTLAEVVPIRNPDTILSDVSIVNPIIKSDKKIWEQLNERIELFENISETVPVITFMKTLFSKGNIVIDGIEYGGYALTETDDFEINDPIKIVKILNESEHVLNEASALSIQIGDYSVTIYGDFTKFGSKKHPNYSQIIFMIDGNVVLRFINVMFNTQIKTYIVPVEGNAYQVDSLTKEGMDKLLSIPEVIEFFNNHESDTITSMLNICRFYDI